MPDNDLGTAHGRIRITYEGKGAEKAEASIHKMAAQLEAANKRLEKLEKELQRSNKALEDTSTQMRKTSRSTRLLDGDILKTARRFRAFRGDVRMLKDELDGLHRGVNRARNGFAAMSIAAKIFNKAGQIDANRQRLIFRSLAISMAEVAARTQGTAQTIRNAQDGIFQFIRQADRLKGTRATVTLMGAGFINLRNKILGVGKEIDRAPSWVRKLNLVAKSVGIMGSALGLLSAVMGPLKLMEMFAKSGVFGIISRGMNLSAIAFKRFGNVSNRVFGRDVFSGFVRRLIRGQNEIDRTLAQGTIGFERWANSLRNNSGRMIRWAADSKYLLAGVAAFINGIGNMWSRLQWFFKLPKTLMAGLALFFARVLPTALSATGKALSGLSNLFLGLIDGVMQLGAGLSVIPGIVSVIGATFMGLFPILKGLGKQFKDLFDDDPTKRWEALGKLPDHLRPIGQAIAEIVPRWKDLQKELQTFALAGVDKQLRELADVVFPLLREGSMRVGGAFRNAKDRLVEFIEEQKTQADAKNVYASTAQMINSMADAIKPALRGLQDMAVVGAQFLQVTATWVPILSQRFQEWAQVNRQNGNMMNWMIRAKQGAFDLVDGIISAAKAARTLFGVFSTNTGEDFLQRFADSMERMNIAIERSRAVGFLAKIRNGAANMGAEKMNDVIRVWKVFTGLVESLIPFISELSNAFSTVFLRALEGNMRLIGAFLDLLNAIGATPFLGWMLGVIAAAKILPKVFATALTALKTFWGFFMIMRNREKVVNGLTTAFTLLGAKLMAMRGPLGTLGNGMNNASGAFNRMAGMVGTLVSGLAVAGVAVLAFWSVWTQASDNTKAALKAIEDSKNGVIEFGDALRKSFLADRTIVGRNVMNTVSDGLNTMMSDLENVESNMPGVTNHIKDFLANNPISPSVWFDWGQAEWGDTEETNRLQATASAAAHAREQFTQLKDEGVDLDRAVTGSAAAYKAFTDNLRATGKGDAADALDVYRRKFEAIEESMRALGPAGADVANGLKQIGEAGSDASEKLDGLRLVLQGLGYLKTDTLQATAEYTEAIQTMADKVTEALTGIGDSGDAWNANGINLATDAGRALLDVLVPVSQKFQAMASNGGDANQMWADMQGEIDSTVTALNNAGVKIDKNTFVKFLQQQLGVSPVPIALALQIDNTKDPIAKQFGQAMLSVQGLADNGVFAPIFFDTEQAAKDLDQALEKVLGHDVTDVNGNNLVLKPGIQLQPDDLAQLQTKLQEYGFKFGPQGPVLTPNVTQPTQQGVPGTPPIIPGQPAPAPPVAPPAVGLPAIAPAPPLPGQISPTPTPQIIVGAPEVVTAALDQIKAKMKEIDEFNPTIDFNLDLTQTALDRLNDVKTKIDEIKNQIEGDKIVIDIQVLHVTESNYDLERLKDKLNEVLTVVSGIGTSLLNSIGTLQSSLGGFVTTTNAKLDEFIGSGRTAGEKFVQALADGMNADNPANPATKAAATLAEAIKDRFHQSPPKKGPLSAHGDAAKYAGAEFVKSYASGIDGQSAAVSAAERMGQGATMGAGKGDKNYEAGQYLGQLSQLSNFAAMAVDAFSKLANTVMSAVSFAADPLGKGTFFGQRQGFVRDPSLSDKERQQKKEDAAQQRALQFYGSGQRPDLYDPKTGRMKGAATGTLPPGASQQDKANFIIDKAMSLGYSRDQANQFLVQAVGESGLAPDATSSNGLWKGIFQFDTSTWEGAGGGDVNDAQKNIENYFQLAAQRGLTPETFTDPHQLGTQVSIGGPLNPKNVGHEATARANAQQYIAGYQQGMGQVVDGITAGVPAAVGNLPPSTKLNTGPGLEATAVTTAALLEQAFPGITQIGGQENRPAGSPQSHTQGRALDVGVGSGPSAAALGDKIFAWAQANYSAFGIQSAIWKDVGHNFVANEGGGPGTTYTAGGHGGPSGTDSTAHVHIQFADGGKLDVNPDGTMNMSVPSGSPGAGMDFGLPRTPEQIEADAKKAPTKLVVRNPDGSFSEVHGAADGAAPGDDKINPATGKPWTTEEATAFWNRPENAMQYDESTLREGDLATPGLYQGTEEQMLDALKGNNPELAKAIATAQDYQSSDEDTIAALNMLQSESQKQKDLDTPESRSRSAQLDSVISGAASDRGLVEEQTPVQKAQEVVGAATSIAGDVFQVLNSAIEAVGAAKNIGDTLVRGVENTEDIYAMIDDIQKFIQLGADVAGAVSSIASTAGSFTGGMDMGITSAVGSVAGLIQGALETVNAMIDLGQEAYRIIGSYVGDFLGILVGGAGGALQGNVKFLLDEANNQLLSYSADNPLDKRNFDGAGTDSNKRNQMIGNINVYGGPGSDPRDNTRQMMFQVKASTMGQATGQ